MGFIDGLISDKGFVLETLLSLVDEERTRIVSAGLLKQEDCDRVLGRFLKAATIQGLTKDEVITKLTSLHESMKGICLAGDSFGEDVIPTVNTQEVIAQLDDLVFKLGSCGKHKAAYELEQVIKSLQEGD
jgi:hypothetical protein